MLALFIIGLIFFGVVIRGWALSTLWAWFLVPIGLPAIGIATALGISVIIGLFTVHLNHDKIKVDKSSNSDVLTIILTKAIGGPLMSVFLGWIITLFM